MTARAAPDSLRNLSMSRMTASARSIFEPPFLTLGPSRFLTHACSKTAGIGFTASSSGRTAASMSFGRTPAFTAASYVLSGKRSQPPNTRSGRSARGTSSRTGVNFGFVRLPSRSFCICVTEPKGFARPLRIR